MSIITIAAVDKNNGIGYNNKLLFRIPEDMNFFKEKTIDGGCIIMGHNTFKSIGSKPLSDRYNIVISSQNIDLHKFNKKDIFVYSIDKLLQNIYKLEQDYKDLYIIGGARLYNTVIELNLCHKIYLTKYYKKFTADTYFPNIDNKFKYNKTLLKGMYNHYAFYIDEYLKLN